MKIAFTSRSVAALRENDLANRRPPTPSLTTTLGGTIAAVYSRCRLQRKLRIRHGQALDRLMGGRTVIAISHRLSSLRGFDRVVVMQAGLVCEDGPPQALVRRNGVYSNLLQREVARLSTQAA
jgi:hypothetical protein